MLPPADPLLSRVVPCIPCALLILDPVSKPCLIHPALRQGSPTSHLPFCSVMNLCRSHPTFTQGSLPQARGHVHNRDERHRLCSQNRAVNSHLQAKSRTRLSLGLSSCQVSHSHTCTDTLSSHRSYHHPGEFNASGITSQQIQNKGIFSGY